MLACPHCGGRLRLIATLHDPVVIRKILAHLVRYNSNKYRPARPGACSWNCSIGLRRRREECPTPSLPAVSNSPSTAGGRDVVSSVAGADPVAGLPPFQSDELLTDWAGKAFVIGTKADVEQRSPELKSAAECDIEQGRACSASKEIYPLRLGASSTRTGFHGPSRLTIQPP